ncbi:MAG: GNAT family N-acetyltransferase [Victivallaceae bacterium]|jgi:ribosomal protein S18 acetylase RimI-like enzyme
MIRKYKSEDLPAITAIAKRAWINIYNMYQDAYGDELFSLLIHDKDTAKEREINNHVQHHPDWIYICEENGKIVGFIAFNINQQQKIGQIGNNAVDPECGLKGIGQQMYSAVFKRFKEEGLIYAQVRTGLDDTHLRARRAYERAGFNIKTEDVTYFKKL